MTTRTRPSVRRRVGIAVAFASLGTVLICGTPAIAQGTETPAEKAAREIGEARDRANAAAQAWAEAQSELDQLAVTVADTEAEIAELEAEIAELEVAVQEAAIERFVSGSVGGVPLLNGLDGPNDQAQANVLAEIAADVSAEAFDDYDAVADELADKRAQLESEKAQTEAAAERLEDVEAAAYDEIEELQRIEADRLRDEAVRKALEAQEAERQRQAEEAARAQEMQQRAEAAKQAQEQQQQSTVTTTPSSSGSSGGTTAAGSSSGNTGVPVPVTAPPTAGGTTGGSTGGTSSGYLDGIVCPVAGTSAFGDTWGAPRSGGRRHEGVDMLGATGTPLAAVTSGYAEFKTNALGGNAVGLKGSNGNYYYYAHLDRWEGSSRMVTRGEIIGYMGDTGNATGTPHLHFEIHPGGGAAVNPYPSVRAVC